MAYTKVTKHKSSKIQFACVRCALNDNLDGELTPHYTRHDTIYRVIYYESGEEPMARGWFCSEHLHTMLDDDVCEHVYGDDSLDLYNANLPA